MNVEVEEYNISTQITEETPDDSSRKLKKIVRALRPNEEVQKIQEEQQKAGQSIIIFRLKRNADNIPVDLLAIDNIELPTVSKKLQTKRINDLEQCMQNLSISKEEKANQETEKFKEALLYFDDTNKDTKLVLKRIDLSNIFDLQKNEGEFRKHYKTIYNDMHAKSKREAKILERRKELFADFVKDKKDNNKYKIYDVNLKKEPILLNGKRMIQQNFLEIIQGKEESKKDFEEEGDGEYDYLYLDKAYRHEIQGASNITFGDILRGKITNHLVDDEVNLVHDDAGDDSEEEINQNYDNYDSNGEDNPANDYPDEEEEGLANSDNEEESDFGDYEDDEDYDDDYEQAEKKSKNFFDSIKNMADDNFKWPKRSQYNPYNENNE